MPPDNAPIFRRKLSDAFVRSLAEPGKYADGEVPGLYLEVRTSRKVDKPAFKCWRLKYRLHGKENRFSIGVYPEIGLHDASHETSPPHPFGIAGGARRVKTVASEFSPKSGNS